MQRFEQGSILKIDKIAYPVVVISNQTFHQGEAALVCPIIKNGIPGPLHIVVKATNMEGIVYCEQVRYLDLRMRHYAIIDQLDYYQTMDISDAVIGIVEYLN